MPGWGVYDSWEKAMSFNPKRYKAFTDSRIAREWLDAQNEAAASAALPRGKYRYYAVRDTYGFGVYSKWTTVQQLGPRSYKGFNDIHEDRLWLDGPETRKDPSRRAKARKRKKRKARAKTCMVCSSGGP